MNNLKIEFKKMLNENPQNFADNLEQQNINNKIQEIGTVISLQTGLIYFLLEGKILKIDQYSKSAEIKVLK